MKKFYAFFILMAALLAASAQTVDFEIVGFVDSDGNTISSLVLRPSQDLQPRVKLKNNGPDAVAATDSVIFDVTYNEGLHVTSVILMGTELHSVVAGEDVTVDLLQPIWTAATMSQHGLTECNLCYEVRIAGHSTDPNPANNKACIDVTRTVSVGDDDVPSVSLFPNPASASVILALIASISPSVRPQDRIYARQAVWVSSPNVYRRSRNPRTLSEVRLRLPQIVKPENS